MADADQSAASRSSNQFSDQLTDVDAAFEKAGETAGRFAEALDQSFVAVAKNSDDFRTSIMGLSKQMTSASGQQTESGEKLMTVLDSLGQQAETMASAVTGALSDLVTSGEDFSDIFSNLILSLSQQALAAALQPLEAHLTGFIEAAIGGLGSLFGGAAFNLFNPVQSLFTAVPFAQGGVLNGPTYFPLSQGLGVAGEAGAEAVLPLARGNDGRLGVHVQGTGASTGPVVVNIQTPDVDSFRRSETQVSAAIARAVERGRRSL